MASSFEDRYEKIRVLGQGAFGQAWLVKARVDISATIKNGSLAVAKFVLLGGQSAAEKRVIREEAALLARANHRFVARYYETCEDALHMVIVMEYAAKGSVHDVMAGAPYGSEEDVARAGAQLLEALAYLHAQPQPILHRDLKPANVFVAGDGSLRLGDFGLAKALDATYATTAGVGTLAFMAPEILLHDEYDARADVWSAGATLYTMLTGKLVAGTRQEVRALARAHFQGGGVGGSDGWRLPTEALEARGVSPAMVDALRAALTVDRGARPTAAALLRMPAFAGLSTAATVAGDVPRAQLPLELAAANDTTTPTKAVAATPRAAAAPAVPAVRAVSAPTVTVSPADEPKPVVPTPVQAHAQVHVPAVERAKPLPAYASDYQAAIDAEAQRMAAERIASQQEEARKRAQQQRAQEEAARARAAAAAAAALQEARRAQEAEAAARAAAEEQERAAAAAERERRARKQAAAAAAAAQAERERAAAAAAAAAQAERDREMRSVYYGSGSYSSPAHAPAPAPARSSGPLTRSGAPDMRYSSNRGGLGVSAAGAPLKMDGTPDMRYSANKAYYGGY